MTWHLRSFARRCRPIHSHSNLRQPVVAAAVATCPSLLPASYEFCSTSRRRFSSFFRNSLMHELSNEHRGQRKNKEGGIGNIRWDDRSVKSQSNHRHPVVDHKTNQHNQRPRRRHSTRLISISAARLTTQQFLDAFNNSLSWGSDTAPWKDARTLLSAEHALEFWAHRSNHSRNKQHLRKQSTEENSQSTLEEDAETALRLFTSLHHFHCRDGHVLNNGMYSHVIDALAKSPNLVHVCIADELLRQFIALHIKCHADEGGIAELHDRLTKSAASTQLLASPSSISLTLPDNIEWNQDEHHFPNQIRITGVMRGYARQPHTEGAESLLSLMISLSSSSSSDRNRRMFRPNEIGFATVIDAYSRKHDGSNAERVLQLMKKRSFRSGSSWIPTRHDTESGLTPINGANVVAYNAAISAWARSTKQSSTVDGKSLSRACAISSSRAAAERAESLLREMWSEHDKWNELDSRHKSPRNTLLPDVVTYSTVISAYATCLDQPYGMKRARELLKELEGLAGQEERNATTRVTGGGRHPHGFQPNTTVYNTLLQAYANAGDASTAETILLSMMSLHSSSLKEGGGPYQHVRPNTRTFNVVLNAWSKSGGVDGGMRAQQFLDHLEETASNGDGLAQVDVISYNTVLAAWAKSSSVNPSSLESEESTQSSIIVGESAAYEALKLLDKIEHRYMESRGNRVVKPDVISYNTTIAAFANAAQHSKNGSSLAEEAEAILSRMKTFDIKPDDYSHNGVLLAWARSSGGLRVARRAESILRSMKAPSIVSWSAVVTAYAHADDAPKAESLLREMEQSGSNTITPSIVLYNNVLHAWGKSSDVDASHKAEALLNRMENTASGLPKPDVISYRLVLTALEHTKDPDKAERAKSVLDRLLASVEGQSDYGADPREIQNAYNSVLTACAYTPADAGKYHRNNASRILVETLRDMNWLRLSADGRSSIDGPNQESYALFMQGCTHLFEPNTEEQKMLLKSALRECCSKGLLNNVIWEKFCNASRPELVKTFIEEKFSSSGAGLDVVKGRTEEQKNGVWKYVDLPKEWSRNCSR